MIDLHCHIIYDTDDGAKTLEESINIIKEAVDAGFTKICCTPHYLAPQYTKTKNENLEKIKIIQKKLLEQNIEIEIFLGNEIYITENIYELIESGKASRIGDTDFILIEFPMNFKSSIMEIEIDDLISRGYKIILAHPERYVYVQKDIEFLNEYIERGVYLQGNYESLLGKYGNKAKKTLIKLLKRQKISILSTDNHKESSTYSKMYKILKILKKYAKNEYFESITVSNQQKILKNIY